MYHTQTTHMESHECLPHFKVLHWDTIGFSVNLAFYSESEIPITYHQWEYEQTKQMGRMIQWIKLALDIECYAGSDRINHLQFDTAEEFLMFQLWCQLNH